MSGYLLVDQYDSREFYVDLNVDDPELMNMCKKPSATGARMINSCLPCPVQSCVLNDRDRSRGEKLSPATIQLSIFFIGSSCNDYFSQEMPCLGGRNGVGIKL